MGPKEFVEACCALYKIAVRFLLLLYTPFNWHPLELHILKLLYRCVMESFALVGMSHLRMSSMQLRVVL